MPVLNSASINGATMNQMCRNAMLGGLSGFLATIPMTIVMEGLRMTLPKREQYPLPPRLITQNMASKAGARKHLTQEQEQELAWCTHFMFGTSMGAAYSVARGDATSNRFLSGALFGCLVWAVSYQGWLPAMGILAPADEHPARRVLLMVAAHVVYGVAMAEIDAYLKRLAQGTAADHSSVESEEVESESTAMVTAV